MPQITKRSIVGAKEETTDGTFLAPVGGTDTKFLTYDPSYRPEATVVERNPVNSSFARKRSKVTLEMARIAFETEVVGATDGVGALGTEPSWALLLRSCGFKPTVTASVNVIYDPVTNAAYGGANGNSALSMVKWEDGVAKKLRGGRGNLRITGEAGGIARFAWDFMGIMDLTAPLDDTFPALAASYDSQMPPVVEQATFAFHGITLVMQSFSIDIGNVVSAREDANAVGGLKTTFIGDRHVTGQIVVEQELRATFDEITRFVGETLGAFTVTIGTVSKNRVKITTPANTVQIVGVDEGDRNGIRNNTLNLEFKLPDIESATDKEIRFTLG